MSTQTTPKVGDVVRVRKATYTGLLEVDLVDQVAGSDLVIVSGRIPYRSTYEQGGQYEGSYRGRQTVWLEQVVEVVR